MLANVVLAISNVVLLWPFKLAVLANDLHLANTLLMLFLTSFFSHLFLSHKHDFRTNSLDTISFSLVLIDMLLTIVVCVQLLQRCSRNEFIHWLPNIALGFGLHAISEYKHSYQSKLFFMISHSIWHICIFSTIGKFLTSYYRNNTLKK